MIELKWLISVTLWIQIVCGSHYGSRMRTQALANSNIDGRIAAILNTGPEHIGKYDTFKPDDTSLVSNLDVKPEKVIKKYGSDSPKEDKIEIPIIEVSASDMPVGIIFRTNSPKINVEQHHQPAPTPKLESTRSEEEPHRVIHEVYRPVIQEIMEVIQPYRKFVQKIEPVIEEVHQIISSGKPQPQTDNSLFKSQPAKVGQNDPLTLSASYLSKSMQQNAIPRNLLLSDSPQWIRSTQRKEKNIPQMTTIPEFGVTKSMVQSLPLKSQKKAQNPKNKNTLQNRYIHMGGALSGLKMEGTEYGIKRLQSDDMYAYLSKPNKDYSFYEVKFIGGQPLKKR